MEKSRKADISWLEERDKKTLTPVRVPKRF
jgi:hypothetical protein